MKKSIKSILFENRKIAIIYISILLTIVGISIILINIDINISKFNSQTIEPMANMYGENAHISKDENSENEEIEYVVKVELEEEPKTKKIIYMGDSDEDSAYTYIDNDHDYKEKIIQRELYKEDGVYYSKTNVIYIDYDNENRYSTYDYRHGYSYRTTSEYLEKYKNKYVVRIYEEDVDDTEHKQEGTVKNTEPKLFVRFFKFLDREEVATCYDNPPEDKVFYVKCPA